MTREQKIDMFTMRLDGYTLQQIGDKYGITRERVRQILSPREHSTDIYAPKSCIYPALGKWMNDNKVNAVALAKLADVSQATIYNTLRGVHSPSYYTQTALHTVTGLPYDVMFQK